MSAYTLAQEVLDVAVSALADPPDRQYVTWGDVAVDCDQLLVAIRGITPTDALPSSVPARVRCAQVPMQEFWVELHRCAPVPDDNGQPPTPAEMETFAQTMSDDQEDLMCRFLDAIVNNEMTVRPQAWTLQPSEPLGPSGAFSGVRLRMSVQLNCVGGGS